MDPGGKKILIGLNLSVFVMMLGTGMIMPLLPDMVAGFSAMGVHREGNSGRGRSGVLFAAKPTVVRHS